MAETNITTDYLVIGAGLSGLSFVDELVTRTAASITIVDKRDGPGGHWNDAYRFVKLHQPSSFYGVESQELSDFTIDQNGFNKGLSRLATGPEIIAYMHALMRNRLLPSGRVTFLPLTEYQSDGSLRGILSGKRTTVTIRKRVVDASWYNNAIPLNHKRSFTVGESVTCVPPNDLPRMAKDFEHYTILGSGKTAMDACLWLLENGTDPKQLRWVIPRDYWITNRAKVEQRPEVFMDVMRNALNRMNDVALAENARDLAHRHEKNEIWMRLDRNVEPQMYHAATMAPREVEELRRIKDVIRQGHVRRIEASGMTLTKGSVSALPNTLYIDCTASAISPEPLVPVFQRNKITIQMIQYPFVAFSGTFIAFLESLSMDDDVRNSLARPLTFGRTVEDYVKILPIDFGNRARWREYPEVLKRADTSRLRIFGRLLGSVRPEDTAKLALLEKLKKATVEAQANLPRLVSSTRIEPSL